MQWKRLYKYVSRYYRVSLLALIVTACGGGGGGGGGDGNGRGVTLPTAPTLSLNFGIKQLLFSWSAVSGVDHYRLLSNPDGVSGFTQVANDIPAASTSTTLDIAVHRQNWTNAIYLVQACNSSNQCSDSNTVNTLNQVLKAIGYVKASNTGSADNFGWSVALAADGNTLAVGAYGEDSSATGLNGDQMDNSAADSGAVYVYARNGSAWSQQAYVKASNTGAGDWFGISVALSADGNTLAVGASYEGSGATGLNGDQADNSASNAGAVYVFARNSSSWSQQAYVKASNTGAGDHFGSSVTLAADGNTLAVGAYGEDSNAIGLNGVETDDSATTSGAVYVYARNGSAWNQQAYVKASNTESADNFGSSMVLSADGNTLAVGALGEDSNAIGLEGVETDNSATNSGAVYVFTRSGSSWSQQAYVKASNTGSGDNFGSSMALSADGNTLAVGALGEDSNAIGLEGVETDNSAANSGAVYVFVRNSSTWNQQSYVKASNTGAGDRFGWSVALSADTNTLSVGAINEDSSATGLNGDQMDNNATDSGAVYIYDRNISTWTQLAYLKASNTEALDWFGNSMALSQNGNMFVAGALYEDSAAIVINGNQSDNSSDASGAVYLY